MNNLYSIWVLFDFRLTPFSLVSTFFFSLFSLSEDFLCGVKGVKVEKRELYCTLYGSGWVSSIWNAFISHFLRLGMEGAAVFLITHPFFSTLFLFYFIWIAVLERRGSERAWVWTTITIGYIGTTSFSPECHVIYKKLLIASFPPRKNYYNGCNVRERYSIYGPSSPFFCNGGKYVPTVRLWWFIMELKSITINSH